MLVQLAPRQRRIDRIRDLGPDVRAGVGQLGKCRAGPGDRDHLAAWAFGISLCVSTQEIMHAGDGQGSITHCGCDAFGCAGATVAGRENSGT